MKKCVVMLGMILLGFGAWGQSLGKERVTKIKESVIKILVDTIASGTGFFVSNNRILTCYHVIKPSIVVNKTNKKLEQGKNIYIQFNTGEVVQAFIDTYTLGKGNFDAQSNDYAFLVLGRGQAIASKYSFLKLGESTDLNEGDEIYACGYPFNISQQIISKGMVSAFFKQPSTQRSNNKDTLVATDAAWLDMTLNKGNSGGPIIKLGIDSSKDVVVGIATFILNPHSDVVNVIGMLENQKRQGGFVVNGVNQADPVIKALAGIRDNSIGVSGMYMIKYAKKLIQ